MKSKTLPWKLPPIIGYQMHAFPLAITFTDNAYLPWFYSNYIQLFCKLDFSGVFFDFFNLNTGSWFDFCYPGIPCITSHSLNTHILFDLKTDIHQLIKSCIDREFYLSISVDDFYIPQRRSYRTAHFIHDLMIFGYNLPEQSYQILGFRNDHMFGESQVSFKELEQGYQKTQKAGTIIYLFKKNRDSAYQFDPNYVKATLTDYLESRDSTRGLGMLRNPDRQCTFGLTIYESLKTYLKQLLKQKLTMDIRAFHILWEHKKCMNLRLQFIQDHHDFQINESSAQKFIEVEQLADICRNLALRYSVKKDQTIVKRMSDYLDQIMMKEREAISALIQVWPD